MPRILIATLIAGLSLSSPSFVIAQNDKQAAKPAPEKTAVVNLNTATVAQLATLPGIGEKAAQRIIEYRDKNGGFTKVEQLMNVKGIGEKSFLKLKPMVTLGEAKPAGKQ